MLYYRVKPEFDNVQLLKEKGVSLVCDGFILIAKELYTEKELNRLFKNRRLGGRNVYRNVDYMQAFDKVNISKKRVYWCFGARFENTLN